MKIIVAGVGLIIGYLLNNYTLTVDEDEKGNFIIPNFHKVKTPVILLWNTLIPAIFFAAFNGFTPDFFRFSILSSLLSAIFFIDFKLHIIPNLLNLVGFIAGILIFFWDRTNFNDYIIGGVIGLAFFLIIIVLSKIILKKDGMGLGDAKLMCVVGLMMGTIYTVLIILLSFIFGAIGASIVLLTKKKIFGEEIAFGPYIVIASMVVMFFGYDLLMLYLG